MLAMGNPLAILLFTFTLLKFSKQWSLERVDQPCGTFYPFESSSTDYDILSPIKITNGGTILDFGGDGFKFQKGTENNDRTNDIEIDPESEEEIVLEIGNECSLTVCNATNLQGMCAAVSKNVTLAELRATEFTIASAQCVCEKTCNCEDISLRRTECARAYLDKSCDDCNAHYADLRPGDFATFPNKYRERVDSLVVKEGCQLTLFSEGSFKGKSSTINSKVTKDVAEIIGSYKCTCSKPSGEASAPNNVTRPPHFPPMLDLPLTSKQVNRELNKRQDRHPGLIAALQSLKSKRPARNAYIMLLGLTGAGKSSTINFLFDNPTIARAGDGNSTTTDIHEYQIPIPVEELGIANSELRVIDTPGLVDTRGLEQDAKFMATLDKYLSNHEDLRKYVPNVILVFAKFNDNRFSGDGASFVKMLRAIDVFRERIMAKKYSNVIIVLTHYMSESPDITRNPNDRLASIRKVVEEYSQFPKPTVLAVAENKPFEEGLTMMNGFYRLANGEFYPRNLFGLIQAATIAGEDPIGEAIIRTAFKNPDGFKVTRKDFTLTSESHPKFLHYLGIIGDTHANPGSTEISELLHESYEKMDTGLKRLYPDTLDYVQRALFNRRILVKNSLPSTTPEIAKFFTEIRTNPAIYELLNDALSLSPPIFPTDYLAGQSYKLVSDMADPVSPFSLENTVPSTDIGFSLPTVLSCALQNTVNIVFQNYNSLEEYLDARLKELNVEGALKLDSFQGKVKAGRNILNTSDVQSALKLTALLEYQTFKLTLTDNPTLSDRFTTALNSLSEKSFDPKDFDNVQGWTDFFSNFGSHVVQSAYGGGSLELRLEYTGSLNETYLLRAREEILKTMYSTLQFIEDSMIGRTENVTEIFENITNVRVSLRFRGGDYKYYLSNISHPEAGEILEQWRDSITFQPTTLENGITLLPISEIVKKAGIFTNSTLHDNLEKASLALLNSSLVYQAPPRSRAAYPQLREDTFALPENSGSMEQFMGVLQTITAASKAAQEKFLDMWEKTQQLQAMKEAERLKEEAEDKKAERQERLEAEIRMLQIIEADKDRALQLEVSRNQREMTDRKLREDKATEDRRIERENQYIAQQDMNKQQELLMSMIMAQNQQVAQLQAAAMSNREPGVLEQIGGFVSSVAAPLTMAFGALG